MLAQQSGGRLTVLHVLDRFPDETVYSGAPAFRLIDEYRSLVAQASRGVGNPSGRFELVRRADPRRLRCV